MSKKRICEVDESGLYISKLAEWKRRNPGAIYFDSPFEWRCWMKLKNKKSWDWSFHPNSIILMPDFKTTSFVKGKIITAKVQDAVYTPDFLINTEFGSVYIECKGFFSKADRIRFKLCQYTLLTKETNKIILLIKNDLEFDKLLSLVDSHFNYKTSKNLTI
jgi:hypothetical protein